MFLFRSAKLVDEVNTRPLELDRVEVYFVAELVPHTTTPTLPGRFLMAQARPENLQVLSSPNG